MAKGKTAEAPETSSSEIDKNQSLEELLSLDTKDNSDSKETKLANIETERSLTPMESMLVDDGQLDKIRRLGKESNLSIVDKCQVAEDLVLGDLQRSEIILQESFLKKAHIDGGAALDAIKKKISITKSYVESSIRTQDAKMTEFDNIKDRMVRRIVKTCAEMLSASLEDAGVDAELMAKVMEKVGEKMDKQSFDLANLPED